MRIRTPICTLIRTCRRAFTEDGSDRRRDAISADGAETFYFFCFLSFSMLWGRGGEQIVLNLSVR
jgi:hypothetical protein